MGEPVDVVEHQVNLSTCRPAWLFDDSEIPDSLGKGERAVRFVKNLTLTEGPLAGKPLSEALSRWQERLIRRVYGDVDENGRRKIRTVILWLPRGNGKTTLVSALGLLHLFGPERDAAGQVIVAASDREQASIAYNSARRFVEADEQLVGITRTVDSLKTIKHPRSDSIMKAISHEAYSKHGLNVSLFIADEVHAWPAGEGRELYRVIRTSMGKREQPLTWIISTAGRGDQSLAWDLWDRSRKLAAGEIHDPSVLPVIFAAPKACEKGDQWKDEALWAACNPGLDDGFINADVLRGEVLEAEHLPAEAATFRQLRLNVWQEGAVDPWLDLQVWDRGAQLVDLDALEGEPCWVGVDLASVEDTCAVVACWRRPDGGYIVHPWIYIPEGKLKRRNRAEGTNWQQWVDDGHVIVTPGDVVDYDVIEGQIIALAERFQVLEVAIDRFNATGTINRLMEAGVNVLTHGQGYVSMSGPCKEFQRAVLAGEISHGGHPALRWQVGNAVIDKDPAENIKVTKMRSREKIDAVVAAVMAVGRASADEVAPSPYLTREEGFVFI
ncbi:MAG: terminase large subunit [Caenispirillum sp.]|nr:terminase large subunit [Caenispirillum sp.]